MDCEVIEGKPERVDVGNIREPGRAEEHDRISAPEVLHLAFQHETRLDGFENEQGIGLTADGFKTDVHLGAKDSEMLL